MLLEVKGLISGYQRGINIINGVNLQVEAGKIVSVIGPNGAGKSTLLKTIYGFLKPKEGKVIFNNKDITGYEPYRLPKEGLIYIPQEGSIFPNLSVRENLEIRLWNFVKNKKALKEYLDEVYERFPFLKEKEKVKAGKLSGGEQRIVDLGAALMLKPKMILLDEPTAGLAPIIAEGIYKNILKIAEINITVLLVDQNIRKAAEISDYMYILKDGKIVDGGPSGIFRQRLEHLLKDWLF
ncbi:MAG: ABC transporter ATP-binding protein [Candidatus Bathyarchaeia archaeon]